MNPFTYMILNHHFNTQKTKENTKNLLHQKFQQMYGLDSSSPLLVVSHHKLWSTTPGLSKLQKDIDQVSTTSCQPNIN